VRAVEFRPGTAKVVHHSLIHYIRGGSAAKIVSDDGKPGFGGAMPAGFIPAFAPAGEIGVWTVGATPHALPDGLATPLPKGSDIVLQLHLHPSGKPETERAKVGIYFAPAAPARKIRELGVLGFFGLLANIDIPPGEKNYTIKGSLTLPADMQVISVLAHAHYLGKEFKATATLPDGSVRPMLWIKDWDFNWQDRYVYKQPVSLPKGTRIDVTISYDNSADNPHNPCNPPVRVQWGLQSYDEMGGVRFQMVTSSDAAEADMEKAAAGIRAAVARLAQSETAQEAIRKAAERNADMQERFRAAAGQTEAACSTSPTRNSSAPPSIQGISPASTPCGGHAPEMATSIARHMRASIASVVSNSTSRRNSMTGAARNIESPLRPSVRRTGASVSPDTATGCLSSSRPATFGSSQPIGATKSLPCCGVA
jgi:hypothetical protein